VLAYAAHEDPEDIGALEFKLAKLRANVERLARFAVAVRRDDELVTALSTT
jgi:hypothetical protein